MTGRGSLLVWLTPSELNMLHPQGRRVYPSVISATIAGVEVRENYNAECNAPPICVV